jgi:biopolymer transport protein ExbB
MSPNTPQAAQALTDSHNLLSLVTSGGFAMYPLVICSLLVWAVIFERLWRYRKLGYGLNAFHLEAINILLRGDREQLKTLCHRNTELPTSRLLIVALERQNSRDRRLKERWAEAVERKRQILNLELRENLWVLGTIGAAAPFIGLFGTVVGILRSFQDMSRTGSGGFAVVASGISESLIATASGIVVAVIAVMAYNAFQVRWTTLVTTIRIQTEEMAEMLINTDGDNRGV